MQSIIILYKNKQFHIVIICIGLLLQLFIRNEVLAKNVNSSYKVGEISIHFRGANADNETENTRLIQGLNSSLKTVLSSSIFSSNILPAWGIIIDGSFTESEGYFSSELKTPAGLPAILLQRNALINEAGQTRLIAHELFHLMHFQKRPKEADWVQEGLAQLTEYLVTGNFNRSLLSAFTSPETSLTEGFAFHDREQNSKNQTLAQYGHALQYFYYLYRLCGKNELYEILVNSSSQKNGVNFIDEQLKILAHTKTLDPICTSFEKSFVAFEHARFFPKVAPSSSYIISADMAATVRPKPNAIPLPPFSARAFKLQNEQNCSPGIIIDGDCFEIRLGN